MRVGQDINKRKSELTAICARINTEKKLLAEEKSAAKRKLDALVQCIEHRRNRYRMMLAAMGTLVDDGGGGGDEFSIGEHRIRLAQEKLELQETGDGLDGRVQKLETEIRAMENTLRVLNAANSCYKTSLSSVNPASGCPSCAPMALTCFIQIVIAFAGLQATSTRTRWPWKRRTRGSMTCGCRRGKRSKD